MGAQRRGIADGRPEATSIPGLARDALRAPFFLAQAVPLPPSTLEAVDFLASTDLGLVGAFWPSQLSALRTLIEDSTPMEPRRRALIPNDIRPAGGKLHLAAFLSLTPQCGLGGRRWRRQFIYGFELAGVLCQEDVFPVDPRTAKRRPAPTEEIFASALTRFRGRSAKSGRANGKLLWAEDLVRQEKGWMSPPFRIDAPTKADFKRKTPLNYAFRFGS